MDVRTSLLLLGLALLGPLASAQASPERPLLNACAGDLSNIPYWTKALKSEDRRIRVRAVQNLGEIRSDAVVPALTEALKDSDPDVRVEAARALERIRRAR